MKQIQMKKKEIKLKPKKKLKTKKKLKIKWRKQHFKIGLH